MKYTIKVFSNDPATTDLNAIYSVEGIQCDGFAIIADQGDSVQTGIEDMSVTEIAHALVTEATTVGAAYMAVGIDQAKRAMDDRKAHGMLSKLVGRIADDRK